MVERLRSDGSSCWLEATYSPVLDAQGRVLQILKIATDITARHARSRRSRSTCAACRWWRMPPTRRCSSATGLRILHVNGGFTRMFGWTTEEVAGRTPIALLAPQMSEEFVNIYRTELRAGQPVGREEIVVGKNGQRYWAKVISNPILDADGRGATRCPC
jgi:PAS domain-containing protein